MEFQVAWFIFWGMLWAVYFMLDGFDLGAGILHPFVAKTRAEKRLVINTIGPVWGGNEVWLIAAGGATFAAFPTTYALMFSYLYSALLFVLFALIFRGAAFEFRGKGEGLHWEEAWDMAIFLGSLVPALLFGVAFGNIFRGLPIDSSGYHGTLLTLLNPYGLLAGALFVLLFAEHGALWLAVKTTGEVSVRAGRVAGRLWYVLSGAVGSFLAATGYATKLSANYLEEPILFLIPAIAVLALAGVKILTVQGRYLRAFAASCVTVLALLSTGIAGLYPNLVPSRTDPGYSLTIFNSSSSHYTLKLMTIVAIIFVPVVIAYQVWIYRIFRRPLSERDVFENPDAY